MNRVLSFSRACALWGVCLLATIALAVPAQGAEAKDSDEVVVIESAAELVKAVFTRKIFNRGGPVIIYTPPQVVEPEPAPTPEPVVESVPEPEVQESPAEPTPTPEPAPAPTPAPEAEPVVAPAPVVEEAVIEEVIPEPVVEPVIEEVDAPIEAVQSKTEESHLESAPEPVVVTEPVVVAEPVAEAVEPFVVRFAGVGATYRQGSGQAVALTTSGQLAADQDLLVLAWSKSQRKMVDSFAFALSAGPWEIPASKLDLLPVGGVELQLIVRDTTKRNKKLSKVVHSVEMLKALVPFEIAFVNAPAEYELGSGRSVALSVGGELEVGADVLIQAWSDTTNSLVDGFAFSISDGPWVIPTSKLELLPEGSVELQLIVRDGRDIKVKHRLSVVPTPPVIPEITLASGVVFTQGEASSMAVQLSSPLPDECQLVARAWSVADQQLVAGFEHTLSNSAPVIAADKLNLLTAGEVQLRVQLIEGGEVVKQAVQSVTVQAAVVPEPEPTPSVEPIVRFSDTPTQYTPGSGVEIGFEVENLPVGGDVLIIAWSDAQGGLVNGFGHYLTKGPWKISSDKLDQLPGGNIELQLIVRGGDVRPKTTHRLNVNAPATTPTDDPVADEPVDPQPDTTTDPAPAPPVEEPVIDEPAPDEPVVDDTPIEVDEPGTDGSDPQSDPTPVPDLTGPTIGFTTLIKSADTRVIYVSHSRGNDSNDGLSESKPVKTLKRGAALVRVGKPDWLLLKAGDVWDGQDLDGVNLGGAGADKPMVVGVYGDGPRPLIIPPHEASGITVTNNHINGLVIQGLHIYAATRDPGSSRYINRDAEADGIDVRLPGSEGLYVNGLIVEDCKISHFDANLRIVDDWARKQGKGIPGRIQCTLRRNIIQYASGGDSHSIGIYVEGTRDSVIEQNLIDHNGWAQTDSVSQRNKRSHNIYAQAFNGPLTIRHNIITRGAAHGLQLRAGGDIEHNLFARNALAFWTAINDSKANYNVILESDDMNPDVPEDRRGVGIEGWDMRNYEVIGNVVARRLGGLRRPGIGVSADNVTVKGNTVYDWEDKDGVGIVANGSNKTISGNLSPELFNGQDPPYVDPNRGVESYAKSIGLQPSFDGFISAVSNRPRGQWVDEYDPATICRYIRNGFDLLPHD